MTKKDYQAIARAVYQTRDAIKTANPENLTPVEVGSWAVWALTSKLADICAADNARFDRARFIEACETGRCKGMRS